MSVILDFVRDRDAALLSLDREKILAYFRKYHVRIPQNEKVLWASIHKARLSILCGIPESEKEKSRQWLRENGFKDEF